MLRDPQFFDLEDDENKAIVAGSVYLGTFLDKNVKKRPLVCMHGQVSPTGFLSISHSSEDPIEKKIDLNTAKIAEITLKDAQTKFMHRPVAGFHIEPAVHDEFSPNWPTSPGLGLVLGVDENLQFWRDALRFSALSRDRKRDRAKRSLKRGWLKMTGKLKESGSSYFDTNRTSTVLLRSASFGSSKLGSAMSRSFDSFEEMLVMPELVRHRIPPSKKEMDSVFSRMLEIEANDEWTVCTDKDGVFALKSLDAETGIIRVLTHTILEGADANLAFSLIYDTEKRQEWDKNFSFFRKIQPPGNLEIPEETDIVYVSVHTPFGFATREMLEWRRMDSTPSEYRIYLRSCDFDNSPIALNGAVRAEAIASAYLIRKIPGGTDLTIYSHTDIKGSIPKFLVNAVAPSAPLKWVRRFRDEIKIRLAINNS
jgi:START domain